MAESSHGEAFTPERSQGRRRVLLVVAAGIVLAIGAGTAIGKAASYASLLHELRGADTAWLAVCFGGGAPNGSGAPCASAAPAANGARLNAINRARRRRIVIPRESVQPRPEPDGQLISNR